LGWPHTQQSAPGRIGLASFPAELSRLSWAGLISSRALQVELGWSHSLIQQGATERFFLVSFIIKRLKKKIGLFSLLEPQVEVDFSIAGIFCLNTVPTLIHGRIDLFRKRGFFTSGVKGVETVMMRSNPSHSVALEKVSTVQLN
jgi:hypothetical protein